MTRFKIEADDDNVSVDIDTGKLKVSYASTWDDLRNDINSASNWVRNGKRGTSLYTKEVPKRLPSAPPEEVKIEYDNKADAAPTEYDRSPFKKEHPLTGKRFA
jgi:hypothetical protein